MEAPMKRPEVVWLGGDTVPILLKEEIGKWGMRIRTRSISAFNPRDAAIRAVLVPFVSDLHTMRKTLSHAAAAANAGALVAVAIENETDRPNANLVASSGSSTEENQFKTILINPPHVAARCCAEHDPGREVNVEVIIEDPTNDSNPVQRTLLQRAFSDFRKITIQKLSGGRSQAVAVWKVCAFGDDHWQCEPFAVKTGKKREILEELAATVNKVSEWVPFPNRPPVAEARCVVGSQDALIVSMFVDRVFRLDEYLSQRSAPAIIDSLFDGPLRRWRDNRLTQKVQLAVEYTKCGVMPKSSRSSELNSAFESANRIQSTVLSPIDLVRRLNELPPQLVDFCFPHGDLHTRNIFVRKKNEDIILIDFANSKNPSPAARDIAALEVAIAFDVRNRHGLFLSDKIIRSIYRQPLLLKQIPTMGDNRLRAIMQLRKRAKVEHISHDEYDLTVACFLLNFARFPVPSDEADSVSVARLKGLAYILACEISENIHQPNSRSGWFRLFSWLRAFLKAIISKFSEYHHSRGRNRQTVVRCLSSMAESTGSATISRVI
jgi:hypothetical protein